jgi:Do/DeqQ family serine protease
MSFDFLRPGRPWRHTAWMGAALFTVTLGAAGWRAAATPAANQTATPQPAVKAEAPVPARSAALHGTTSYADTVARVAPSVVTVRIERKAEPEPTALDDPFFRRFFGDQAPSRGRQPLERGLGSGVIVSSDGRILTNAHVVEDAERVRVTLQDGRELTAKVVGVDKPSDLAVIQVSAQSLPALPLGNSDQPRVGDVVLAVGNPLGIGQTVTMGILSAKGRTTAVGDGSYEDFLQTDAPINQGNSGGALVSASGELIGITSQILSPSGGNIGIGFAIPSNMAKHVMNELVTSGHVRRAKLGVTIQPVTAEIAESLELHDVHGALVNGVEPDSPAEQAGVRTGDVITKINGDAVDNYNELRNRVSSLSPGSSATLTVVRDGREQDVRVKLGEMADKSADASGGGEGGESQGFGIAVEPLTPQLAAQLEVPRTTRGLAVTDLDPDGAAAAAGLQPGDVIRQVNGKPVTSAEELRQAARSTSGRPALVLVQRGPQSFFATLERRG